MSVTTPSDSFSSRWVWNGSRIDKQCRKTLCHNSPLHTQLVSNTKFNTLETPISASILPSKTVKNLFIKWVKFYIHLKRKTWARWPPSLHHLWCKCKPCESAAMATSEQQRPRKAIRRFRIFKFRRYHQFPRWYICNNGKMWGTAARYSRSFLACTMC